MISTEVEIKGTSLSAAPEGAKTKSTEVEIKGTSLSLGAKNRAIFASLDKKRKV